MKGIETHNQKQHLRSKFTAHNQIEHREIEIRREIEI